ncbi:hypothetical protein BJX62DRAFT_50679 [Aspergillus germanicus]
MSTLVRLLLSLGDPQASDDGFVNASLGLFLLQLRDWGSFFPCLMLFSWAALAASVATWHLYKANQPSAAWLPTCNPSIRIMDGNSTDKKTAYTDSC